MNDLDKILLDSAEKAVNEFKSEFESILLTERNLKPDAKALKNLTVVRNDNSKYIGLVGVDYIYWVVHGREPGRFPPPYPDGTWRMPFPVARKLAMYGNIAEMLPTANAYDLAFEKMVKKIDEQIGKDAIAFILKTNSIY